MTTHVSAVLRECRSNPSVVALLSLSIYSIAVVAFSLYGESLGVQLQHMRPHLGGGEPKVDGKVTGYFDVMPLPTRSGPPRLTQFQNTNGVPQARDTANRTSVLGIGWFTSEQTTQGCIQLSEILSASAEWKRHFVKPSVLHGHILGIGGTGSLGLRFGNRTHQHAAIDTYFDIAAIRSSLQGNGIDFVEEQYAREKCQGEWTLVYLASKWRWDPVLCAGHPAEQRKAEDLWISLRSDHNSSGLVVTEECDWLLSCLSGKVEELTPFRRIVCAAVSEEDSNKHTIVEVGEQLFGNDSCVLLMHWFGSDRHEVLNAPEMAVLPFQFTPAPRLQALAEKMVGSFASRRYVSLHIRTEYFHVFCHFTKRCKDHANDSTSTYTYGTQCLALLQSHLQRLDNGSALVFSWDVASDSRSLETNNPLDEKVYSLKQFLQGHFQLKFLPDAVSVLDAENREYLSDDLGRKAIVDATVLVSADQLFVVGGGNYQSNMLARRAVRRKCAMDQGICYRASHDLFSRAVVVKGKRATRFSRSKCLIDPANC